MQLGLSTYTYTWSFGVPGSMPENPMTINDLVDKAVALQLDCIQVADNVPLHQKPEQELEQILQYATEKHIAIETGFRGLTSANLQQYIQIAARLKSRILRVVIDMPGYEPEIEEVILVIRKFVPQLEKLNILLAIENHDRLKAREFIQIIEGVNSTNVGMCLDTVNSFGAGEGTETIISLLAPYTVNVHLKEFTVKRIWHKMGFVIEGAPLGEGMLPVEEIFEKTKRLSVSAILEQWTPPCEILADTILKEDRWAEESIRNLKIKIKNLT